MNLCLLSPRGDRLNSPWLLQIGSSSDSDGPMSSASGRKTGLSEIDFEYPFIARPAPFGTKRFRVKLTNEKSQAGLILRGSAPATQCVMALWHFCGKYRRRIRSRNSASRYLRRGKQWGTNMAGRSWH